MAILNKRSILIDDALVREINDEGEIDGREFSAEVRALIREAIAARRKKR